MQESAVALRVSQDEAIAVTLPSILRRGRYWQGWVLGATSLVMVVGAAYYEMKYFTLQARVISSLASGMHYTMGQGPAPKDEIHYPKSGPFDVRMGYTALPNFLDALNDKGYFITTQARWSPALQRSWEWGLFSPYREKSRAGLVIQDRNGATLYEESYPHHAYNAYEKIAPLIVNTLLFIENRDLLDSDPPLSNPAVEWDRMARVTRDLALDMVRPREGRVAGGSTLATQIEKYRHSPGGLTTAPMDKLQQMGSASLRAYLDGADTRNTRRHIVLDYINTVPLAARRGYGEVNGLGDGLWVWYGVDPKKIDDLLQQDIAPGGDALAAQALAFKQVLSLFIAQRRPSYYLGGGTPERLNEITKSYLGLLAQDRVITPSLRDAAITTPLRFGPPFSQWNRAPYVSDKAVSASRTRLATMLDMKSLYQLDRLDLTAHTTFEQSLQNTVTDTFRQLKSVERARSAGLIGERMLSNSNDLSKVVYSFMLIERTPTANLVRVQADNLDQPFDINEGVKLDLGSSAKLRTLVSYLNIIAALHQRYAELSVAELEKIEVNKSDVLTSWAVDYLHTYPESSLASMLAAAMERKYSASPYERFITGGGIHTFENFDKVDNNKIVTVRHAFRNSINLPFVRMMRDIVSYYIARGGSDTKLIEDANDERRSHYLERFADREGSSFIKQFYRKYKGKTPQEAQALLLEETSPSPSALAMIYNSTDVAPTREGFITFLHERLPGHTFTSAEIGTLFEKHNRSSLLDQGYISHIPPLELWTVTYLARNPHADSSQLLAASVKERQAVYSWLRNTRHKDAQDKRIFHLLEMEAFLEIHKEWKRLGYPFDNLVPSYATSIGSSADRPAALAELMGIIINNGVRLPTVRIEKLHFAANTPYETEAKYQSPGGEQVLNPLVATEVRDALRDIVDNGTARRLHQPFTDATGNITPVGGKTGTGDHRYEVYNSGGKLVKSTVMNRTATFVFYIGDRYFGTITAFVPGVDAKDYKFTSSLPVQLFKALAPVLEPYMQQRERVLG